jgi:hypothetical protein
MAEWLRRLTRNQMGSSRVGSNPTRSEETFFLKFVLFNLFKVEETANKTRFHALADIKFIWIKMLNLTPTWRF